MSQCWWDHVSPFHILPLGDVSESSDSGYWMFCNWLGTYVGQCSFFATTTLRVLKHDINIRNENLCLSRRQGTLQRCPAGFCRIKPYIASLPFFFHRATRGLRSKTKRMLTQFLPHDFTTFRWEGTASFTHYVVVVILLAAFLTAELTPFYLKSWVEWLFWGVDADADALGRIRVDCCGWSRPILS